MVRAPVIRRVASHGRSGRKGLDMKPIVASFLLFAVSVFASAQEITKKPVFMDAGVVEHDANSGRVTSSHPRPLFQAVEALSQEYGWVIDFEDPPYFSKFDLTDDTDPNWKAKHPASKGVSRVAGGPFESIFPEPAAQISKEQVLQKVISDYNSSGNPGKFALRKEGENRFAVVGVSVKDEGGNDANVPVLLDTLISVPQEHRSAYETLNLILDTLSTAAGTKVHASMLSTNGISAPDIVVGGTNVSARTLLLQTFDEANKYRFIRWELRYSPDINGYFLIIAPASEVQTGLSGPRSIRFINRAQPN